MITPEIYYGRQGSLPECERLALDIQFPDEDFRREVQDFFRAHMQRGFIKLDVDDHLTDSKTGSINDDRIFSVIQEMTADGWLIGLSSRRNVFMLREQQRRFGTNGPNDAEYGAITDFADLHRILLWDERSVLRVRQVQDAIRHKLIPNLETAGFPIDYREITDAEVLDHIRALKTWPDPEKPYGIWMNMRRISSLTAIVFQKSGNGVTPSAVHNPEFYGMFGQQLQDLQSSLHIESNPNKNAFVLSSSKTTKTYPWNVLFAYLGPEGIRGKRFYHLGDGDDDAILLPETKVRVLVPANAGETALARADRISSFAQTQGAVDNLRAIAEGIV